MIAEIGQAMAAVIVAAAIVALRPRPDDLLIPESGLVLATIEEEAAQEWIARVAQTEADFGHLYGTLRPKPDPRRGRHALGQPLPMPDRPAEETPAESTGLGRLRAVLAEDLDPYLARLPRYKTRYR